MPYIDKDLAIKTAIESCVKVVGHGITQIDAVDIADAFEDLHTADVVPKSEYDVVVNAVDNSTKEFLKLHDAYQDLKRDYDILNSLIGQKEEEAYNKGYADGKADNQSEVERLNVELKAMRGAANSLKMHYEKAEAEIERLKHILDCYALQYGTVKEQQDVIDKANQEFASEIFAEIYEDCFDQFGYLNYEALADLKKKYTENIPSPAPEEKYFSPQDVINMTPKEIRDNYTVIIKSMESW